MARVKLQIPQKRLFETQIPVRITDINYGNHLGNDALVSIVHEARVRWLAANNFTELNIGGASLIMGDLAVEYKNESFYGDILHISIAVDEISKVSFEILYEITVCRNTKTTLIANAKTGMVCYEYNAKKVVAIPTSFLEFLSI
ncbi:MAG: thioesterase family protein [Ferruginibacter sp.]|nr:thioesterase family protein [Ferruginibacter sp.]